ncbi:hypothetical protein LY10_04110 [Planktotalea frisia]|uniref:Uncharacterized protein n=1 Tax=Planktotalea frisia TaxID=696762 RepID=A0A1L9P0T3_9RHOB|nr:hypothetical protein [Planktotalea frisia]OJI95149.1 hypothetical protein PFRI_06020 [Planktotalea frisia]PZX18749.1 hypothetical protein LY10_04110 [Planktotalea frisia]
MAKGKTLLLSGEDCVLLRLAEISALATELRAQFETVEVVAYLRNHRDFLNSAVQQLIRMGFPISATLAMAKAAPETLEPLRVMSPIPAYGPRLRDWIEVFGKDNVHIHNYDRMCQNGQDILSHFYTNHLSEAAQMIVNKTQQRSNSRFSATAIDLLDYLHSRTPPMLNGQPNARFVFNLQRFFGQIPGPVFHVGEAFDRSCSVARDTDRPMLEAILSDESLENLYQDRPPHGDVSVAPLPEAIKNTFADISITAHLSQAREKFFAASNKLKLDPEDEIALGNLRVALFNLNAPDSLRSCASWLLREERYALAQLYLDKAEQVGAPAASLVKMRARLEHNV